MNNLILIGFMGTGKTSTGEVLAEKINASFVDLDLLIEEEAGMTIPDIFSREGEAGFRDRETQALSAVLSNKGQVIATGGGAVLSNKNRRMMQNNGFIILLEASVKVIIQRVESSDRPLLQVPDPESRIRQLLQERKEAYSCAHYRVETSGLTPQQVAETIINRMGGIQWSR